jgi:ribosomal protein S12 methylthiotransferase accessory factor YcaO
MNPRRLLLLGLGATLSVHAALLRAQTAARTMRHVGVLAPSTQARDEVTLKPIFYTTAEKLPLHQPLASAGSA